MSISLLLLFFVTLFSSKTFAQDDGNVCYFSLQEPKEPAYTFYMCRQYEDSSCCLVGHDVIIRL